MSQIEQVLALLNSQEPVFVHCHRGSDRTGTVIACYRIAHDRWDQKQALQGGQVLWYGMGPNGPKALRHDVPTRSVTHG